ncbi:PRC-barrel domain-containing protein [Microvirga lotononidis]|uniref:PRC-barrel protein n=1 Tax=Microvirga lotononidis TaxID=864069 RepID=I4Z1S3_9HYPH|nr:PRC-barrel domain-containing protein [Microvirga lotononidis]EIM30165.1 PRC-barrel protein [Microvirga lotononidis]EIM30875.1 PRC-barrel protein [Microvirga lotononidis]WQO31804.1 PRC-barrel domain-containing protein [Microvirga lotononidis]
MKRTTCYVFHSTTAPDLRGITGDPDGATLPASDGPWNRERQIDPDRPWPLDVNEHVVEFGILENGFYLWGLIPQHASSKPVIESDRVEGTAVFDLQGHRIGAIKRLLIEKVSGRVVYVDVTFGGFLGVGVHHHTIPWEKLTYETGLHGYRTDITEEQVRGAPAFHGEDEVWPDKKREQELWDYWRDLPRGQSEPP